MAINYLFALTFSFLLSVLFILVFKKVNLRYNILTHKGMPLVGGMGSALAFLLVSFTVFLYSKVLPREIIGLFISSALMLIFGLIDDRWELSIKAKFTVQIIATTLLCLFGVRTKIVYIGDFLNLAITFIWVLGITNALNHLDVLDAVAGSTAVIISIAFFWVSFLKADANTAILSLSVAGAMLGFLIYNLPPAKIYMGNSGSHFLGFVLAGIAILISYAPLERKFALMSPLLILGFPIFDTVFLIFMRLKRARSIFEKSNDHLALKFLVLMRSKNKAFLSMVFLALFFSFCGIVVVFASNLWAIVTIGCSIALSLGVAVKMNKVITDA